MSSSMIGTPCRLARCKKSEAILLGHQTSQWVVKVRNQSHGGNFMSAESTLGFLDAQTIAGRSRHGDRLQPDLIEDVDESIIGW